MGTNRGPVQPWEIRLGAVHLVVWLGLVLGAVVASYFAGFFSGRYVGFETARSASSVEVAKLAVTDQFSDGPTDSASDVYAQLNDPTISDSAVRVQEPAKAAVPHGGKDNKAPESSAARIAQEIKSGVAVHAGDNVPSAEDVDSLFEEPSAPIGSASRVAAAAAEADRSGSGRVRVLGGGSDAVKVGDKTVGQIVEERVALARANQAKLPESGRGQDERRAEPPSAQLPKTVEKKVADSKVEETGKAPPSGGTSGLIGKPVPQGFFAQVAAPKSAAEAEEISRRLKRSGFPVVIETASVRGESYYRVLVGPEKDRVTADRLVGQLKGERYLTGVPFIKQVK